MFLPRTRHDSVVTSLVARFSPPGAVLVPFNITPGDHEAYTRELGVQWRAGDGRDLVVVEHDVAVGPAAFPLFDSCPELVCAYPYLCGSGMVIGLGCTRFRAEVMAEFPDAMDEVYRITHDGFRAGEWLRIDIRVWEVLAAHGVRPHHHDAGHVLHLHDYTLTREDTP